jgi:hypothetical protein
MRLCRCRCCTVARCADCCMDAGMALTAALCLMPLQIVLVAEEQLLRTQYSALSYEVKPFARSTSLGLLATALPDLSQVGRHTAGMQDLVGRLLTCLLPPAAAPCSACCTQP